MAQELAFAAPRTEEMTKAVIGVGSAVVTGLAEGVVISMAPALGALAPVVTWGTLLGAPIVGVAGALFTRGMIGDAFAGIAAGGAGVLGYSLPALLKPYLPAGKQPGGGGGNREQLGGGAGVKQLPGGVYDAPQRAQAQARVGIEF